MALEGRWNLCRSQIARSPNTWTTFRKLIVTWCLVQTPVRMGNAYLPKCLDPETGKVKKIRRQTDGHTIGHANNNYNLTKQQQRQQQQNRSHNVPQIIPCGHQISEGEKYKRCMRQNLKSDMFTKWESELFISTMKFTYFCPWIKNWDSGIHFLSATCLFSNNLFLDVIQLFITTHPKVSVSLYLTK